MNALSSIRQLWAGASMGPASAGTRAESLATSIPTAELRELNAAQPGLSALEAQPGQQSFGSLLGQMVQDVNARQGAATQALQDLQAGKNVSLHQAVIAMEEASVSFQLMVEVRNKLLDSYQELMRMQV